jgi:ATP-dependent protease ClpP protease subunit
MVTLELFNEVGVENGITVDSVRSFLNANKNEDIKLQIATLGGDLAQAITIHNLIKAHPGKTTAEIIGLTASAGTVIALACDEIIMSDNALFLIHNGWTTATGNAMDMQKMAADLMKNDALMIKIYREKTGMKDDQIKSIMKASDWLSPDEALQYGFVDRIEKTGQKIAAHFDTKLLNDTLINKLQIKMNIFKTKKDDKPVYGILSLKNGRKLIINAEAPAAGVEIAPVGTEALCDGDLELEDGKKATVVGGVITEVTEPAAAEAAAADAKAETEAIVAAVMAAMQPVLADVDELKKTLAKVSSTHTPAKGTLTIAAKAKVDSPTAKVKEVTDAIRQKIVESREK